MNEGTTSGSRKRTGLYIRIAVSVVLLVILILCLRASARAGFAALLTAYVDRAAGVDAAAAEATIRLASDSAEAHFVRGATIEANGDFRGAAEEYINAARLRPDDYVLWLSLAHAHELNGNTEGALGSARQAVILAPHYAPPRWQLGNILVRAGKTEDGYRELRQAGENDASMWPAIIDLAWQQSSGDLEFIKRVVQPKSSEAYKALAEYLKKRNRIDEALEMFRAAGSENAQERAVFLGELIAAGKFSEAATLWSVDHPGDSQGMLGKLHNPGFEQEGDLNEPGFNWIQDNKEKSLSISLDLTQPKEGRSTLRVDFNGESDQGAPVISQLVIVEPGTRYQLRFVARTKDLVSGGLPFFAIKDRVNNVMLGQTPVFPRQSDWQEYKIEFTSGQNTNAIQLMLQRTPCGAPPCPIFGHLWLDDFVLQKLGTSSKTPTG